MPCARIGARTAQRGRHCSRKSCAMLGAAAMNTSSGARGPMAEPALVMPLLEVHVEPGERLLLHSQSFCVVDFESALCVPQSIGERNSRTARIEFPRRQCEILVEGQSAFVADSTRVVFLGKGTVHRRRAIDPLGARATIIRVNPDALPDVFDDERRRQAANEGLQRFDTSSPLDLRLHEESVALANRLGSGVPFDAMAAEEATLHLLSQTLGSHLAWNRARRTRQVGAGQLEMVAVVKQHIYENIGQRMSLTQLSALVGISPFYLCRFFRAITGQTVYQYQLQIRLAAALEMLPGYTGNLAALAMDLGFSSHSHLTTLFKRAYGYSPGSPRHTRRVQGLSLGRAGL
jgi:AraC-like DNA-binding protein